MLITQELEIELHGKNTKHYEDLGYKIPRRTDKWGNTTVPKGSILTVKVKDLSIGAHILVDVICDCCGEILKNVKWQNYLRLIKQHDKYYCHTCAMKLYGNKNRKVIGLLNGTSFEEWCLNHYRQDILDRWD